MLLPELQSLAASLGISGTARMRKGELIAAIQERNGGDSRVPGPRSTAVDGSHASIAAEASAADTSAPRAQVRSNGRDAQGREPAAMPGRDAQRELAAMLRAAMPTAGPPTRSRRPSSRSHKRRYEQRAGRTRGRAERPGHRYARPSRRFQRDRDRAGPRPGARQPGQP